MSPWNPHTKREMREIAGASIGMILLFLLVCYFGTAWLKEPAYQPTPDQRIAAEEATR